MTQEQAANRKSRIGVVVSDINDQTVLVRVERAARHRLYRKVIRRTKKYHVHDPENRATRGDIVRIEECRPISKMKHFRLVEILTERVVADVAPESIGQELVEDVQRSAANARSQVADSEESSPGAAPMASEPVDDAVAEEPPVALEASDEPVDDAVAEEPPVALEASDEPVDDAVAEEPPVALEASDEPVDDAVAEEPPVALEASDEPVDDAVAGQSPAALEASDEVGDDAVAEQSPATEASDEVGDEAEKAN